MLTTLVAYRIGGIFHGDKFSRIDLQKIFARKKFRDFTMVIMIEGRGRYRLHRKLLGVVQICVHVLSCLLRSSACLLRSLLTVICGHHVYKDIWTPYTGEILTCKEEPGNIHDLYAVAVRRQGDDITVGHVPQTISTVCCLFLKRGYITCEVTGPRQYSNDLPQGGLEVPFHLTFTGTGDDTSKVEKLLNCAPTNNAIFSQSVTPACQLSKAASKRQRIDVSNPIIIASDDDVKTENSDELWLRIEFMDKNSFALSVLDKVILQNGSYLNDKHNCCSRTFT